MIYGIGIDVVSVGRLQKWISRPDGEKLIARFFALPEITDSFKNKKTAALSLAARFAAKEAFGKALGTGLHGIKLKDICIMHDNCGKPELSTVGTARFALDGTGVQHCFVSMSHESDVAVAVVVLEQ